MNESLKRLFADNARMIGVSTAAVLIILALFLAVKTLDALARFGDSPYAGPNVITVMGTGTAETAPTIAHVSFTVQETAETVETAQNAATERTENALRAVRDLMIEDDDIRTSGYNVFPQYESEPCIPGTICRPDSPRIVGYQVTQTIELKIRDIELAGEVLAVLGSAGVQNISGPNFQVDDDTEVVAEARAKAIEDAHKKAKQLARQLDVRLGDVVSFNESGGPIPYYGMGGDMAFGKAESAAVPPLPQGQNESEVTVQVTYEIH